MADDGEWVEDVKRWYRASAASAAAANRSPATDYGVDLGYEAAHPCLQARHWPDATTTLGALTTDR